MVRYYIKKKVIARLKFKSSGNKSFKSVITIYKCLKVFDCITELLKNVRLTYVVCYNSVANIIHELTKTKFFYVFFTKILLGKTLASCKPWSKLYGVPLAKRMKHILYHSLRVVFCRNMRCYNVRKLWRGVFV